jgi:hypothetical protein
MNLTRMISVGVCLMFSGLAYGGPPTEEQISLIRHWLSHTSEASIHQMRGATGNQVFLHTDGHREAVYDRKGKLVQDGINDGSYNYAHPIEEPLKHFNRDILPWILWGNSNSDPTTVKERLDAYSQSLGDGLGTAQTAPTKSFREIKIEQTEIQVVEFFLRVIEEGGVPEVLKILKDPAYKPEKPFEIGRGLTEGLNAVISSGDFKPVKPDL